ncbi:MAG: butyrate kinase [Candidatus Cloacimonadota bacterium]|nr:MAG: butyrate kinase [Candidatus Cloacimonadota bacterium]PIE78699.1 MAG: butyrate kinase [Candidatus Delongbacteria bacterium]
MSKKILTINPGSTSTKIAVFEGSKELFLKNIKHSSEEIEKFEDISDQYEFRKDIILKELADANIDLSDLKAIVGRGGLIKPVPSGVYTVNEALKEDLRKGVLGKHASNLGGLIADDIANTIEGARAFIADPVVVDEFDPVARVSGHPDFERTSIFHALNQKAVARKYADNVKKPYEDLNLIVVHLGGGISVGAHQKGRVIDVNQALDGDGPFSPERSGTLPIGKVIKACFSGKYTEEEMKKVVVGKGGFTAYLGTNNAKDVFDRANADDEKAKLVSNAMVYQVSKEIGAMFTVLKGEVDAIILTGGIAYNSKFTELVEERVKKLGEVVVYPGEDEMEALAMNGNFILDGKIEPSVYK